MPLSTNAIAPMSDSPARLGVKAETTYGTEVTPADADAIRVIDPKFTTQFERQKINESWTSRFGSQSFVQRVHAQLTHGAYLYVPRTKSEATAITAYLTKLLLPARMKNTATIAVTVSASPAAENGMVALTASCTTELMDYADDLVGNTISLLGGDTAPIVSIAWVSAGVYTIVITAAHGHTGAATIAITGDFVSDPTDITAGSPNVINRSGNTLWFQETNETRVITAARNNFTLKSTTSEQAMLEMTWLGMHDGELHPYDAGTSPYYAALAKPAHLGAVMSLQDSDFFIRADTDLTSAYHPLLKGFSLDMGNAPALLDDGNSPQGTSGVHIGGVLDNAKITFDIARPYVGSGASLTENVFPWMSWFKNNVILSWGLNFIGSGTGTAKIGIGISGVMQIEDIPAESGDGSLKRLSITGTLKEHTSLAPIRIAVICNT